MKTYFGIRHNFSTNAFRLNINYPIGEVRDTLALDRIRPAPQGFLSTFSYTKFGGGDFEDMLSNDIGWKILSKRLVNLLSECRNSHDVELLPLPENASKLHPKLREYRVLGVKREIPCIDVGESDLHWEDRPEGGKYIAAIYECVLREKAIPEEVDIFRLAEYPMTMISSRLATTLAELSPTGFVLRVIKAVTHQE